MDWPYVHLLINHFTIILAVVGAAAAVLALIVRRRGVWLYAAATITLSGAVAYPTFVSGNEAEETMERAWYVDRAILHDHEEAGELALWVLLGMGIVGAVAWRRIARQSPAERPAAWVRIAIVVAALAGAGTAAWTAYQGGLIVHKAQRLLSPPGGSLPTPTETLPGGP